MKYLILILAIFLCSMANGAMAKAKGFVCVTIIAPEPMPEAVIVYTEIGATSQVVF